MWTKIQTSQAMNPPKWSFQMSATAWPRPITASCPLSQYLKARRGRPARSPSMTARGVFAHLDRDRADAGERAALLMMKRGRVAQDEHLGVPRDGAVGLDDGAAHPVERGTEALEHRARGVAGGPDDRLGRDDPSRRVDRSRPDVGHHGLGPHLDAQPPELVLGLVAQARRDRWAGGAARPRAA